MAYQNHQDASRLPTSSTGREIIFPTLVDKAKWLDSMSSFDALRRGIQGVASQFTRDPRPEMRTRNIHRFCRDRIHYERDFQLSRNRPGEEFADSPTVLRRGYGDCDDKARLFVALMRAAELVRPLGTESRIHAVFRKHPVIDFVHVQADVRWPGSKSNPRADANGWILAELILKGCELGQNPDEMPRGPHGERILA